MTKLTRIHVNGHHIKANKKKYHPPLPVFTVKDYTGNRKGNYVVIHGPSELVYSRAQPLKSGAVAWIETRAQVDVF